MSAVHATRHMTVELLATLGRSPGRVRLIGALLAVCMLLATEVWLGLRLLTTAGQIMDMLVARNSQGFYAALNELLCVIAGVVVVAVSISYIRQRLLMGARNALVHAWMRRWLCKGRLYRMEREHLLDNPDQRIAEDLRLFVEKSLHLGLALFSAVLGMGAYAGLLWQQGGPLELELGAQSVTIPGYMFWIAALSAGLSTWLSRQIAKPLVELTMRQQQVEADFRFGLIQVREHAEQVALYGGGSVEYQRLVYRFEQIRQNWWRLVFYQARWTVVVLGTGLLGSYGIYFLVGGKVLAGALTVGAITTLGGAFGAVLNQLNWFGTHWDQIVEWIAVVSRLKQMDQALEADDRIEIQVREDDAKAITVRGLALTLPDGGPLTSLDHLQVRPGERLLLCGPSGAGKSTLLRAIAGMWPYGVGTIDRPLRGVVFLPQKSYLPWDTLKLALTYPRPAAAYSDEACSQALIDCRLPKLADRLYERDRWSMRLSLGEQQRLAFARVLLSRPDFLFLDESTSALDVDTERHLYQLLLDRLPQTALISVAHRTTLGSFHDRQLQVTSSQVTPSDSALMPSMG